MNIATGFLYDYIFFWVFILQICHVFHGFFSFIFFLNFVNLFFWFLPFFCKRTFSFDDNRSTIRTALMWTICLSRSFESEVINFIVLQKTTFRRRLRCFFSIAYLEIKNAYFITADSKYLLKSRGKNWQIFFNLNCFGSVNVW